MYKLMRLHDIFGNQFEGQTKKVEMQKILKYPM